jgi:hypothetical protein
MENENTSFSEGYKLCDMKFLRTFLNMTVTDQSLFFSQLFRVDIKIIGKEIVFYYNITTKLWVETNLLLYESFVYSYFNNTNTAKILRRIKRNEATEDDEALINQINKQIEQFEQFDKTLYINNIITRSKGTLQQNNFAVLLDHKNDCMATKI